MFSVGVLYSSQEFLHFLLKNPKLGFEFPMVFKTFFVASPKAILDVCQACEWVSMTMDGYLIVSEKGQRILSAKNIREALCFQIDDLLRTYNPGWIPLIGRGRSEAKKILPVDVVQCFSEAGLFEEISDEIISWWDRFAQLSRAFDSETHTVIGRIGEKLSMEYERERTKTEPIWKGFETNLVGYDIQSVVDLQDSRCLLIEVKTSDSVQDVATFHISRNEWNTALSSENYLFHLWALHPKPKLFIIEPDQMNSNIPNNQGLGVWESVKIPFKAIIQNS